MAAAEFNWEDPLDLDSQLTDEERMIRDAARLGQPCPTNAQIARATGLSSAVAASYRLRRLIADGKLRLEDYGHLERRVATILPEGWQTPRASMSGGVLV